MDRPYHFGYDDGMASKLRDARTAAGLSQQQLADLAGTSQPQIDRLEKGRRRLTKRWATRLAPHVGKTPDELTPEAGFAAEMELINKQAANSPAVRNLDLAFQSRARIEEALTQATDDEVRFGLASTLYRIDSAFRRMFERRVGPDKYADIMTMEITRTNFMPILRAQYDQEKEAAFIDGTWIGITRRMESSFWAPDAYAVIVWDTNMLPDIPGGLAHIDPGRGGHRDAPSLVRFKDGRALICYVLGQDEDTIDIRQRRPRGELQLSTADISSVHQVVGIDYQLIP